MALFYPHEYIFRDVVPSASSVEMTKALFWLAQGP